MDGQMNKGKSKYLPSLSGGIKMLTKSQLSNFIHENAVLPWLLVSASSLIYFWTILLVNYYLLLWFAVADCVISPRRDNNLLSYIKKKKPKKNNTGQMIWFSHFSPINIFILGRLQCLYFVPAFDRTAKDMMVKVL